MFIVPPELMIDHYEIIRENSEKIHQCYKEYLIKNGFQIVEDGEFINAYYKAVKSRNGLFDPLTGRCDRKKQYEILNRLIEEINADNPIDYVIIPKLEIKRVDISKLNQTGRWDGVERVFRVEKSVTVIPNPFALSLYTEVHSMSNGLVLANSVGLDFIAEVKRKNRKAHIMRKKSLFDNKYHLEETISLSFDPFVPLK